MPYLDTNTRSTKTLSNENLVPLGRQTVLHGLYMGFVKDASDVQRNGRLKIWIPELGAAPNDNKGWITANYCSPFAGATSVNTISKANLESFDGTQTSYGMWMIPPDIDNIVLVMFIGGAPDKGVWIGCLYNQYMNNMVPGMAADINSYQYPGKFVPLAEYNKWDTSVTQPDRAFKPYEKTKFQGVGNQGLINDQDRGINNASARRESPSQVFGILTPGPVIDSTASPANIRRKGGSSFIMDDSVGTECVQLTTKSGAQIKLDETNGFVYLINRDGTAWVQMDQKGNVDVFGASSISMRAQNDINLRADGNINIEAGQNIYMKAAKDTVASTTTFTYNVNNIPNAQTIPYYSYVGAGSGTGGNIVVQALNNMHTTVQNNAYLTVNAGNLSVQVQNDIQLTTVAGKQEYHSAGNIDMQTALSYNLNAAQNILNLAGSAMNNVSGTGMNNKAGTSINNTAGSNILNQAAFFDITGQVRISDEVQMNGLLLVSGGLTAAGPVALGGSVSTDSPIAPAAASNAGTAATATPAEIKQLTEKINILATWKDPASKFVRNAQALQTTVSVLPTYEPCPEHETFTFAAISGYVPTQTEGAKTYEGSGGAGNSVTASPPPNTDPGANNKDLPPTPASTSAVTKNFNMPAYQCQLKKHEGVKYKSYIDSVGKPTAGIGHLLRTNEIALYPVPTAVSPEQVDAWFQADAAISISGAITLLGTDVWGNLTDIRKRACADLCYNLGQGKLSQFVRFLAAMKAGDYNAAGKSLTNSKWFTQVARRGPNIVAMIVQNIDPNGCDVQFPPQ